MSWTAVNPCHIMCFSVATQFNCVGANDSDYSPLSVPAVAKGKEHHCNQAPTGVGPPLFRMGMKFTLLSTEHALGLAPFSSSGFRNR
jgi:hypothetical protein